MRVTQLFVIVHPVMRKLKKTCHYAYPSFATATNTLAGYATPANKKRKTMIAITIKNGLCVMGRWGLTGSRWKRAYGCRITSSIPRYIYQKSAWLMRPINWGNCWWPNLYSFGVRVELELRETGISVARGAKEDMIRIRGWMRNRIIFPFLMVL